MDAEYSVELVDFRIEQLAVKTNLTESGELDLRANYTVKMAEPQSPDNPMVMLEIEADITEANNQIHVACSTVFVFKINPAPKDWQSVINKYCPEIVHEKIMDRTHQVLVAMGLV